MEYSKTKRKMDDHSQSNARKIAKTLPSGLVCIILAMLLLKIDLIQIISNYKSRITNGSEIYQKLHEKINGLYVAAYLFNVTNAEEFLRGDDHKLKLQEVGPFTYKEMRTNEDLEIDEAAGVVRYSPKAVPLFLLEESIADPSEVNVTMPNVAMLLSSHGYFAKTAFNLLLQHLDSKPVVRLTAQEYLWGYDEPLISLGNTVLPGWIDFDTLGIMDRLYDSKGDYRLEIATSLSEKFKLRTMNGLGGLDIWDYGDPAKRTRCNTFVDAYEGIVYSNQMRPGTPLRIYRNILCRFMELEYQGLVTTPLGARVLKYKISKNNYDINNDTECLCGGDVCISGISDISPCYYNLPVALSNAHFLDADPKIYERLEGIKPSEEEHGSEILIDTKIGMVLNTTFSLQINVVVRDVNFNSKVIRFSDMIIPVGYFKLIQPPLDDYITFNMRLMYVIGPNIFLTMEILLFIAGILLLGYSLHLLLTSLAYRKGQGMILRRNEVEKPPGKLEPLLGIKCLHSIKQQ